MVPDTDTLKETFQNHTDFDRSVWDLFRLLHSHGIDVRVLDPLLRWALRETRGVGNHQISEEDVEEVRRFVRDWLRGVEHAAQCAPSSQHHSGYSILSNPAVANSAAETREIIADLQERQPDFVRAVRLIAHENAIADKKGLATYTLNWATSCLSAAIKDRFPRYDALQSHELSLSVLRALVLSS